MSVRHALLALLSEGPKYGLQLREEFEARTGEVWPLNVGQVYTTLQRLERDGLVESEGDGRRPAESVPDHRERCGGTRGVAANPAGPERAAARRAGDQGPRRVRLPGTDVHEVIQAHRRYLVQLMQQWTRIKDSDADEDIGLALAVDAELFRLDSVVRWLDAAEARLRRGATTDTGEIRPAEAPLPRQRRRTGARG